MLRTLVPGPRLMLSEMIYRRHASTPYHVHPTEQVGYVVRGRLRLLVGDRESVIAAGETYIVPPEVSHCLEALDDATVLVSSVAS